MTNKCWLNLVMRCIFFHFWGESSFLFFFFCFLDMFSYLSQDLENTVIKNTTRSYEWNNNTIIFIMCIYIYENVSNRQCHSMPMITVRVNWKDHIKPAHLHSRTMTIQLLQYSFFCHFIQLDVLLCPLHPCFQKCVNSTVHCFFCKTG